MGCTYARLFCRAIRGLFKWTHLKPLRRYSVRMYCKRGISRADCVYSLHPHVLLRQLDAGECVCAVGRDGAHLRAHVDDGGLQSTGDSGRVSNRGFNNQYHYAHDELLWSDFGLCHAIRQEIGHRYLDFHDDSILHGVPVGLGGLILCLGLRLWSGTRDTDVLP